MSREDIKMKDYRQRSLHSDDDDVEVDEQPAKKNQSAPEENPETKIEAADSTAKQQTQTGTGTDNTGDDDFYGTDDYSDHYSPEIARNNSQAYEDCLIKGSTSNVAVLRDEWTPSGEQPPNCTFPFAWKGKIYYACTDVDYGGRYWCANSCDFSDGEFLHRGECNIARNTRGVLGTGVALSTLNVFVALLFAVGFTVLFFLCLVELVRRRRYSKASQVADETAGLDDSVELGGRQVVPS